jgi:glycosyltransferase involved in cell wall biosynthesis
MALMWGINSLKKNNKPLVIVYDAPVLEEYEFFHGKKYFFKNKILKRQAQTLKHASHVITYSKAVKKYLENLLGHPIKSSTHQNVDFTRFEFVEGKQLDGSPINIGFVGSFLKWHKVDLLINTYNKLRKDGISAKLYLIGNGMEYAAIKEQVGMSKYSCDIQMTGFLDGKELYEYKKQMHIGIMPGSNWYGAPNKIFEYGAANMAVVAPATPTIRDLFTDKDHLLLFDESKEDGLYNSLKMLCQDADLRIRLAKNLQHKIVTTYSEKATFDYYNGIFVNMTSK